MGASGGSRRLAGFSEVRAQSSAGSLRGARSRIGARADRIARVGRRNRPGSRFASSLPGACLGIRDLPACPTLINLRAAAATG